MDENTASGQHDRDSDRLRGLTIAPDPEEARRAGAALARIVADAGASPAHVASTAAPRTLPRPRSPWRRRAAVVGAVAVIAVGTMGGAAAADSATPGDGLYGVDRALERIGVGAGGERERVAEAISMDQSGDAEGALTHLAAEVAEDDASRQALLDAAATLRENGSEQSAAVHARVADMLEWMATTDATGKDFGQGVSERARALKGEKSPNQAGDDADDAEGTTDSPGNSGNARDGGNGKSAEAPGQAKKAVAPSADASGVADGLSARD